MKKRSILIIGIIIIACAIAAISYKQYSINERNIALLNAVAVASGEDGYPDGPEYTMSCGASEPGPYPGENYCKNEVIFCGAEDSTLCDQVFCPTHHKEGK